jgi:hypothetical protein
MLSGGARHVGPSEAGLVPATRLRQGEEVGRVVSPA